MWRLMNINNNSRLSLVCVFFVLGIYSSCGPFDQSKTYSPFYESQKVSSLYNEGLCNNNEDAVVKVNETLGIEELFEKTLKFKNNYGKQFYLQLSSLNSLERSQNSSYTPLDPLILNRKKFKREYEKYNRDWINLTGGLKESSLLIEELSKEELLSFNNTIQSIKLLKRDVDRFNSNLCNLKQLKKKKSYDVRPLFMLRKIKTLSKRDIEEVVLEACSISNTVEVCLTELNILKRKRKLVKMTDHYQKVLEEKERYFYSHEPQLKFKCLWEENYQSLILPIEKSRELSNALLKNYDGLKLMIEEKWQYQDKKVIVKFVEKGDFGIKVNLQSSPLSYVDLDRPSEINMSNRLSYNDFILVFTHELGHIFGFRDCYHEFYDQDTQSLIYYSLDISAKNLMCAMSYDSVIPKQYIEKVFQRNCE